MTKNEKIRHLEDEVSQLRARIATLEKSPRKAGMPYVINPHGQAQGLTFDFSKMQVY